MEATRILAKLVRQTNLPLNEHKRTRDHLSIMLHKNRGIDRKGRPISSMHNDNDLSQLNHGTRRLEVRKETKPVTRESTIWNGLCVRSENVCVFRWSLAR